MAADYTRAWGSFHGAVSHLQDAVPTMVDEDLEALAFEAYELTDAIEAEQSVRREVKGREHPGH